MTKERITLERTFDATLDDVWDLWTTKEGIESWWGPDGFRVEVRSIDLRPGGKLYYAMIAHAAPQVAFMKNAGMPLVSESNATYVEVEPKARLAYDHSTDFIPGIAPYDVRHTVAMKKVGDRVQMTLTFDRMHDEIWTGRAKAGWENELDKLANLLAAR